ncbi:MULTISPECIES: DUF4145 domain-containing protein [unclassified Mesorhizobium]|uniref:DUF4145 domain-containing protein n=1 Tax=unclassified Mesorhizobium TaxID=325217 RepID=UPI001AECE6FA|nr:MULTISPECIES: DUF4145 domain-containing protein [unclassified Mesorhizobium]
MRGKYVPPSTDLTAFNCPHCGALAKQFWHYVHERAYSANEHPQFWTMEAATAASFEHVKGEIDRNELKRWVIRSASGTPFFDPSEKYGVELVVNLNLSKCYNCAEVAIWRNTRLMWPAATDAPDPNPDLPDDVRADYDEAGLVLNTSPRSAAALLRQAVQRLCAHLGEKGKNIDADIAALVQQGLDKRIQKALDIVRVVGNNAVHPGQIDLKDDRATAEKLFGLVNLIADTLISQPKHIDAMFDGLPAGAKQAIEKRDAPKQIEDKSGG